jgi:hypothetical protein
MARKTRTVIVKSKEAVKINLRIEPELHRKLQKEVAENRTSLQHEITSRLELSFGSTFTQFSQYAEKYADYVEKVAQAAADRTAARLLGAEMAEFRQFQDTKARIARISQQRQLARATAVAEQQGDAIKKGH